MNLKKDYRKRLAELNNELFEAEQKLEILQRAVSAARYYLVAAGEEMTTRTVLDLVGAIDNYRAQENRVSNLRNLFEAAIYEHIDHYEGENTKGGEEC